MRLTTAAWATGTNANCTAIAAGATDPTDRATAETAPRNLPLAFIGRYDLFLVVPTARNRTARNNPRPVLAVFSPHARLPVNLRLLNQAAWLSRHAYWST